ncbi:GH25 family lysozyme [Mesorhizobium prunaredense]|nr:GH25 family lysozyme [Mesorhizobium prunaredense]
MLKVLSTGFFSAILIASNFCTSDCRAQEESAAPLPEPGPTTCAEIVAPASFEMASAEIRGLNPNNDGIKPSGFVKPSIDRPVIHGIDISKYQDEADFRSVKDCGGSFAYVRLSGGTNPDNELLYRTHWANTRASDMIPGPYHNFSVIPHLLKNVATAPSGKRSELIKALTPEAMGSAKKQAALFSTRLAEVLSLDPSNNKAYLPIAIDLSVRPLADDESSRQEIGTLYGAMVCEFIGKVSKGEFGKSPIVLFSDPDTFEYYRLIEKADSCSQQDVLIWIRHRTFDGSAFYDHDADGFFKDICKIGEEGKDNQAGRCLIEQYTSFGGFALFKNGSPLDLDRIFASEQEFQALWQGSEKP